MTFGFTLTKNPLLGIVIMCSEIPIPTKTDIMWFG